MKKFLAIVRAFWQRSFAYRFTIIAYRLGETSEMLILIFMWKAIYADGRALISGFTEQEMITYVLIGNFFHMVVRNFLSSLIAIDIKEGRLSMYLIRPMSYFRYVLSREIGRISLVAVLSLLTQGLVMLTFSRAFVWNAEAKTLLLIAVMLALAFVTELLIAYLVGLVAFWTDEIDGLYSTIDRLKKFFSGGYFPISLLPAVFVKLSLFFPFAYAFFVPSQLYLKKIDASIALQGLLVQGVWIVLLYALIKTVWKRGLIKYEGVGM